MSVEKFIRFEGEAGATKYGELGLEATKGRIEEITVPVLSGDPYTGFEKTGERTRVKKV
jgi:hypothetical protein